MKHISHAITDLVSLQAVLDSDAIRHEASHAQSVLIQVYSAETDRIWIHNISEIIFSSLPNAVLVGATTVGEIAHGLTLTCQTVVGFTFFFETTATSIALSCPAGEERRIGGELSSRIGQIVGEVAGVLLLATPLSINIPDLLDGIAESGHNYPIFGGGAGRYTTECDSVVFAGEEIFPLGVIAVVLTGTSLHIESRTHLGWRPLGKEMTITEVDGKLVKSIDGKPSFDVYRRYLDIPNDDNFLFSALEFPFLFQRDEKVLARIPTAVTEQGDVQFVSNIDIGEKFRVGYGDPGLIIADAVDIQNKMRDFAPQAIFLYTCCSHRFLMQKDVELETLPFEQVAPTFGFYTHSEFFGTLKRSQLLNSTMVAIGLREGKLTASVQAFETIAEEFPSTPDPYANKHLRIVSRLVQFISAVAGELEEANHQITELSLTDRLTKLSNRRKLEAVLDGHMAAAIRHKHLCSIILLDIDHFKQVNDTYGHLIGDEVLVRIAQVIAKSIRETDTAGRWGGEEFMVISPHTDIDQACALAERIREAIAQEAIPTVGHKTASFGVAAYTIDESMNGVLSRADEALYEAKRLGRNRVQAKRVTDV